MKSVVRKWVPGGEAALHCFKSQIYIKKTAFRVKGTSDLTARGFKPKTSLKEVNYHMLRGRKGAVLYRFCQRTN